MKREDRQEMRRNLRVLAVFTFQFLSLTYDGHPVHKAINIMMPRRPLFPLPYRPFTARLMPFAKNLLRRPSERDIMMFTVSNIGRLPAGSLSLFLLFSFIDSGFYRRTDCPTTEL